MTMYRVSATFSQRELIDFIDANGTVDLKIEAIQDPDTVSPHGFDSPVQSAIRRRPAAKLERKKRGSKVVETILEALKDGEADIPALKSGLSKAGLSENSLSTGLAILQKDGRVKRNGDGVYALANAA